MSQFFCFRDFWYYFKWSFNNNRKRVYLYNQRDFIRNKWYFWKKNDRDIEIIDSTKSKMLIKESTEIFLNWKIDNFFINIFDFFNTKIDFNIVFFVFILKKNLHVISIFLFLIFFFEIINLANKNIFIIYLYFNKVILKKIIEIFILLIKR